MANNNRLKAFVRYDGSGRIVPSSLILQRFKPKVGNWVEIDANECCNYVPTTTTTSTSSTSTTTSTTTTSSSTTSTTTTTVAPTPTLEGSISIAASTDFDIVGDFTIEMFTNLSSIGEYLPVTIYLIGESYDVNNTLVIEDGNILYFNAYGFMQVFGQSTPIVVGEWNHIAIMGSGSTLYLFINGVVAGSNSYLGTISSNEFPLIIGFNNADGGYYNGLISNFRWTSAAVYNVFGFTPPTTPLTALPDTKLLILQGTNLAAQLTDNSGNGNNATNFGATYSSLSPFVGYQGSLQTGST